jgi:hypothetical protein
MSTKRRHKSGPPFIRLFRFVKRSQAYHDLSLPARCALIEIMDRYTGINNGMIGLSVRTLADALKCSQATATRALRELDDSRLVTATTVGFWPETSDRMAACVLPMRQDRRPAKQELARSF